VETGALLRQELKAEPPTDGLEWVFGRTRGNPLFTLEFVRYLRRQGFFWSDGEYWHWRQAPDEYLPVTVETILTRFIADHVTASDARLALQARTVLPVELESLEVIWAKVTQLQADAFGVAKEMLERAGIIKDGAFTHPLLREIVSRTLSVEAKTEWHDRIFRALEPEAFELALEYLSLDERGDSEARRVLEGVVERAKTLGKPKLIGSLLARMTQLTAGETQARYALEAAQALKFVDETRATQLTALASGCEATRVDAVFLRAQLLAGHDRVQEALRELHELPSHLYEEQRLWETRIMVYHASRTPQELLSVWDSKPEFKTLAQPHISLTVSSWLAFLGRHEAAMEVIQACLQHSALDLAARCRLMQAELIIHSQRDQFDDCIRIASAAIALMRDQSVNPITLSFHRSLARAYVNQGRWEEALESYRTALTCCLELGDVIQHARIQGALAEVLIHRAEFELAELVLLEAQTALSGHSHALTWLTSNKFYLTHLYLEWQPLHGSALATRYAHEALQHARATGSAESLQTALFYAICVEIQRTDRTAVALSYASELSGLARDAASSSSRNRARASFADGLIYKADRKFDQARLAFRSAIVDFRASNAPYAAERVGLELDHLEGDLDAARGRYDWFCAQGWLAHARTVIRYFPRLVASIEARDADKAPFIAARINVLGSMTLERDGEPVPTRAKKRLEILAYLLETRIAGRAEASALELVDALYAGTPEPEAKNTLKQQVYLIRSSLGSESIVSTATGYALGAVSSDAEDFLRGGDARLWRGAYLGGLSEGFHGGVREALTLALRGKLEELIQTNPREAARLGAILLEMEPYDADMLRLCVEALERSGEARVARRTFLEGRARLTEIGENVPELASEFLTGRATA
jgi:tetratricopeptide (TPR) repeat protein